MSPAAANAALTLTVEVETIMGTLCDLLDRETDAVKVADFNAFKTMQDDKFALLTRYRSLMDTLQRQAPMLKGVDNAATERLRNATRRFKTSTARNAQALEAGRASMQRIVDRIVRTARDTVHGNRQAYTKKGMTSSPKSPLSLQMDEVF